MFDVIIAGGGPAGLNAALILGRCRRRVLLCDTGRPRNAHTHRMNGFLSRDNCDPAEFRRAGRKELGRYPGVEVRDVEVVDARKVKRGFEVDLSDGTTQSSRKLLVATGLVDVLPDVEGMKEVYGKSAFHCPYCDGWELCDQRLAVYGAGESGYKLALELTQWTGDLVLCSGGPSDLDEHKRRKLSDYGIALREEPVRLIEHQDGQLNRIVFAEGEPLDCKALFFCCEKKQASPLAERLGARPSSKGPVPTGRLENTDIPGLYIAGDAAINVQFAVVAAAEGAIAGFAINNELMAEEHGE